MGDRIVTKVLLHYFPNATYLYDNHINYFLARGPHSKVFYNPRKRNSKSMEHKLLSQYETFILVGMDAVDGFYNLRESISKLRLASKAALNGGQSWIINFSWNSENVAPELLNILKTAHTSGVNFIPRDSISSQRLLRLGISTRMIHDLAFLAHEILKPKEKLPHKDPKERKYVILSPCFTIGHLELQLEGFITAIAYLRKHGIEPILFASVTNARKSDKQLAEKINKLLARNSEKRVKIFHQEKELLDILDETHFVITGRMHVAILSLASLVPTFVIEYQGKVSGLLEDLKLNGLFTQNPKITESDVNLLLNNGEAYRNVLSLNIPKFRKELADLLKEIADN